MKAPDCAAGLANDERKRLGQFFTGTRLARSIAALSKAQSVDSILDPMAGTGDMFVACSEVGASPSILGAIELDPNAAHTCRIRTGNFGAEVRIEVGSAFEPRSWLLLADPWDLVITNPPYVRYQIGGPALAAGVEVPCAGEVRNGLVEILEASDALTESERNVLVSAAQSYSGLSDLAVPSWILAASKVSINGRLAIVVPDTWLSRDYAAPVLYVLRRLFEIEYVVVDADASWFEDAIVRTTLVVARRVPDKKSALGPGRHLVVHVPRTTGTPRSIVGAAFPGMDPESAFAKWASSEEHPTATPLVSEWSDELEQIGCLERAAMRHPWMAPDLSTAGRGTVRRQRLPERVGNIVGGTGGEELIDLAGLGWVVGQGLRTGANDFFYVESGPGGTYRSPLLPGEDLCLPPEVVVPSIRNQAGLTGIGSTAVRPQTGVLVLDGWAMPEDNERAGTKLRPISGDLARLVSAGASARYRRKGVELALPELSAVRTNVRIGRFWYHLPPLAPRHTPVLFIARVNARNPRPFLNHGTFGTYVIDANFSTLWPDQSTARSLSHMALLALLSSSWTRAVLESTGTVMGGGALKLEATHLRRVFFPEPDGSAEVVLAELGESLSTEGPEKETGTQIDEIIESLMGFTRAETCSLRALASDLLTRRAPGTGPQT